MMNRQQYTGLMFLAPALVFMALFFLAPVVMTGIFSFTTMSTATGIMGGEYRLSPSSLRGLESSDIPQDILKDLKDKYFKISVKNIKRARARGVDEAMLLELERRYLEQRYSSRRDIEAIFKRLHNRPGSIRELKESSACFESSIINKTYGEKDSFVTALSEVAPQLTGPQLQVVAQESYTGWQWTLNNFRRMIRSRDTLFILANTFIYVVFTLVLFNTGFALILALTTFYLPSRWAAFFRTVWFLPRITPPVLYVLLWKWLAWDNGFISTVLSRFGVESRNWMLDSSLNSWVFIILINGFVGASMGMILFSSGIRAIPRQILYASEVDGASAWQQVRRIILPLLRWPILFVTCYQTLSLLTSFEYILLATDGGPGSTTEIWSLAAYHSALSNYAGNLEYGYGAALSLVLVVIGIFLSLVYLRIFNFDDLVARPRIEQ